MNSSTNPPKQARKFQFDTDFEEEAERLRQEALLQQQQEEQSASYVEPPAPVFSEADLNASREDAFQQGVEQGKAQAMATIENNLGALMGIVANHLEILLAAEEKRLQHMHEIALRTTVATLKKVWPTISQSQGLATIENTVRQSLQYNPEEQRIVIRVHDTMLDPLINRLPQIQAQNAFAGKIIVLADEQIGPSDCKVEWADGGMERLSRSLSAQIDSALDRILASLASTSQNADTERTSQ